MNFNIIKEIGSYLTPKKWVKKLGFINFILVIALTLGACSSQSQSVSKSSVKFADLEQTGSYAIAYASQFTIDEYGDYRVISVPIDEAQFLVVPEGMEVPTELPKGMVALKQPIENTYLVSTPVMDLMRQIGAVDAVRLSGTKESDWYIEEAKEALQKGDMIYAGKYSAPDFELLIAEGCQLAIENTMIYHNPSIKEKLEELGIPVFVERSSYEADPLGRLEWIKVYGLLYGKEAMADAYFKEQVSQIEPISKLEKTGKRVAFFYVNTNGAVNVRKPNDYISKMIEMAGGSYCLADVLVEEENALSTMNMQMEDFYAAAKDADIIIYNSTIDGGIKTIDELLDKSALFADFEAVKNGQVYCTTNNFFQQTTGIAEFVDDMSRVMRSGEESSTGFHYLVKVN